MTETSSTPQHLLIQNLNLPQLKIEHFALQAGQCWAVLGRNGAGKQHLGHLLAGELSCDSQALLNSFRDIKVLSFETQQAFYENELHNDDSEFMEGEDMGTTVEELLQLGPDRPLPAKLSFLKLDVLFKKGFRLLSSGEARKVLLAQALMDAPELLILDEPFDSLDLASIAQVSEFFKELSMDNNTTLLFLLNTLDDVFPWHTHIAVMDKGVLVASGPAENLRNDPALRSLLSFDAASLPDWPPEFEDRDLPALLVELKEGKVSYGDTLIFSNMDITIKPGEHTLLTGANGCGKSTLLSLITGDHPQCYSNKLRIFGVPRGSGESIWELKKRIGIVSAGLHRDHRVPGSALHIVLSGFHDSIGLYDPVDSTQIEHAKHWLKLTGIEAKANVPFKQLSYGEQRLVLIARALVKQPALLILDEPTQGLDAVNRLRVMYFLEHLSTQKHTTIVMASHRLDERLPLFSQHVQM